MNVSGPSAEIGVYKGYTSKLLSIINSNNIHYCYDTFNGVVHYNKEIRYGFRWIFFVAFRPSERYNFFKKLLFTKLVYFQKHSMKIIMNFLLFTVILTHILEPLQHLHALHR